MTDLFHENYSGLPISRIIVAKYRGYFTNFCFALYECYNRVYTRGFKYAFHIPCKISRLSKLSSTKFLDNFSWPFMHKIWSCLLHMWPGHLSEQAKVSHFVKWGEKSTGPWYDCSHEKVKPRRNFVSVYSMYMASLFHVMRQLHLEFKRERDAVKNEHRSGHQISPEENARKVHQMMLENREIGIDSIVQQPR